MRNAWWIAALLLAAAPVRADPAERMRMMALRAQQTPEGLVAGKPVTEAKGAIYTARYEPAGGAIPLARMQTWKITLTDAQGAPVEKARLALTGIMPQHSHGLSTVPTVSEVGKGVYEASGLKFHMPGWWVLHLDVDAGGKAEMLEFQLLL